MKCALKSFVTVGLAVMHSAYVGCSTTPDFESVTPALHDFEPFHVPLQVNAAGVATVTLDSSAGPLELILDTGADQAMLIRSDSDVASQLQQTGRQWKSSASGRIRWAPMYRIDSLTLGRLQYTGVVAVDEDSSWPSFMPGDGVLGRGLLDGLTLDIDMPAGRLGILPAAVLPADIDGPGWIVADMKSIDNGPIVVITLDDSDVPRAVVLDTGAIAIGDDGRFALVELPDDLAPHRTAEDDLPVYDADVIHLGNGAIGPMSFYVKQYNQPPGTHGFLGNALYATHRVVIDPAGMRVFIRRAAR